MKEQSHTAISEQDFEMIKRVLLMLKYPKKSPGFFVDSFGNSFIKILSHILQSEAALEQGRKKYLVLCHPRHAKRLVKVIRKTVKNPNKVFGALKFVSIDSFKEKSKNIYQSMVRNYKGCFILNPCWNQDTDEFGGMKTLARHFKRQNKAVVPVVADICQVRDLWAPLTLALLQGMGKTKDTFEKKCLKEILKSVRTIEAAYNNMEELPLNEVKNLKKLSEQFLATIQPFLVKGTTTIPTIRELPKSMMPLFIRTYGKSGVAIVLPKKSNVMSYAKAIYENLKQDQSLSQTLNSGLCLRTSTIEEGQINSHQQSAAKILVTTRLDGFVPGIKRVFFTDLDNKEKTIRDIREIFHLSGQFEDEQLPEIYLNLKREDCISVRKFLENNWLMTLDNTPEKLVDFFFDKADKHLKEEIIQKLKSIQSSN